MRLTDVKRQLDSVRQRIRDRLGSLRLQRLPEQLREHAVTGQEPDDELAAAYLELCRAAQVAMDESIGGDKVRVAVEQYERARRHWQETLRGAGL